MNLQIQDVYSLLIALGLGAVLGLEREYRSKAAGFRTLTMISLGACLFTLVSRYLGSPGSPDRIASNVVQGIGFLGAGAIFKDNFSVSGLTTATAIWVASAIGMTTASGHWVLAVITTGMALVVLAVFERFQFWLDRLHQRRNYHVTFDRTSLSSDGVEEDIRRIGLKYVKQKESRDGEMVTTWYEVYGKVECFAALDKLLLNDSRITTFDN